MADENVVPAVAGETKPEPQKVEITVKGEQTPTVPDKFKGKSTEDIINSYNELEKKLGDTPKKEDLDLAQKNLAEWEQLGAIIKENPALLKAIEEQVKGKTEVKPEEKRDDVRLSLENRTINDFENNYGINSLASDKKAEIQQKIGNELQDMLDPTGTKTTQQIIAEIPLDKLPKYLDKAYKLATVDDKTEKARLQGLMEARQNNSAVVGSISSSNGNSETVNLTQEERDVARKLGVSEEKYAEQRKKMEAN